MRKKLFSLTRKDFQFQFFRAGGKGGQKQNKVETGVRIIHPASGARAESRTHRTQEMNRRAAFMRLAQTKAFKDWHSVECARLMGQLDGIERAVDESMRPENLKVEML